MHFSKIIHTFYDLLYTTSNSEWLHPWFFTINLLSLINGEAVLLYHNSPYCLIELSGKKDPVFDR